jgi:hypothetical protein
VPVGVADQASASLMLICLVRRHGGGYLVRVTANLKMRQQEAPRHVVHLWANRAHSRADSSAN